MLNHILINQDQLISRDPLNNGTNYAAVGMKCKPIPIICIHLNNDELMPLHRWNWSGVINLFQVAY